jgi:putative redox protein
VSLQQARNRFRLSPEDLILSSIAMCKVAMCATLPEKNKWKLVKLTAELNVKRGEAGKLSTHVTAKIKIEGELTAEKKNLNKPMLVMFHD